MIPFIVFLPGILLDLVIIICIPEMIHYHGFIMLPVYGISNKSQCSFGNNFFYKNTTPPPVFPVEVFIKSIEMKRIFNQNIILFNF